MSTDLTTSTWAIIGEHCPITCRPEGDDLATMLIGRHRDAIQLDLTVPALRRMAAIATEVANQMTSVEREEAEHDPGDHPREP